VSYLQNNKGCLVEIIALLCAPTRKEIFTLQRSIPNVKKRRFQIAMSERSGLQILTSGFLFLNIEHPRLSGRQPDRVILAGAGINDFRFQIFPSQTSSFIIR